jgi:hypothetical protein
MSEILKYGIRMDIKFKKYYDIEVNFLSKFKHVAKI